MVDARRDLVRFRVGSNVDEYDRMFAAFGIFANDNARRCGDGCGVAP
jgi:hypothetical protein